MSKKQVKALVKAYAEILKKHRFKFEQIYLFGSYANGKPDESSDIDVAVVASKLPRGRKRLDKKMELWVLAAKADSRIEPILLEKEDLNGEDSSIMGYEVLKHGILIA